MKVSKKTLEWCFAIFMFAFFAYTLMGVDYLIQPFYTHKNIWILATICLTLFAFLHLTRATLSNRTSADLLILIAVVYIGTWNNQHIANGEVFTYIHFVAVILGYFVFKQSDRWIPALIALWKFIGVVYGIGTIVSYFVPSFYSGVIVPAYSGIGYKMMQFYNSGCISGITAHYTTNGVYLQIGVGVYLCSLLLNDNDSKERKPISDWIGLGITLFALLLCGKRAHLIFSIAAFVAVYYFYNIKRKWKRITKIVFAALVSIVCLVVLAQFVPQVLTFYNRIIESSQSGDLLNGRDELYAVAYTGFFSSPLVGHGWSWYSYNNMVFGANNDAHNVYIQLLCDGGVIGETLFCTLFIVFLYRAISLLKKIKLERTANAANRFDETCVAVALYHEVFFLLYCTSGNPLYDFHCYFTYFISLSIIEVFQYKLCRN